MLARRPLCHNALSSLPSVRTIKEDDTFRGATKFAKNLRRTIDSAWEPPKAPITIVFRGKENQGVSHKPLLSEVGGNA